VSERLVIVGGGQAAFACAAKLRSLGDMRPITMIAGENSYPYQRPPLSKKYLLGEMDLDRLMFRPAEWYAENEIDVFTGTRAIAIDRQRGDVELSNGDRIEYGSLVLATGSTPRSLPASMTKSLEGIFTIRSYADADRLRPHMGQGRKLLVVGGGYIGLEAAAVARHLGMEVTVIEAAERILARVASPATAAIFRDIHVQRGVRLLEGTGLSDLIGQQGRVTAALLADGTRIEVDLVIAGIGAFAEDGLARDAGIACGNGITVDQFGRTSDPAIYAAGICPERRRSSRECGRKSDGGRAPLPTETVVLVRSV
jgi:3-phenylpropionate/trans-cinnamate dioxygenase ferredoxin reductase component